MGRKFDIRHWVLLLHDGRFACVCARVRVCVTVTQHVGFERRQLPHCKRTVY
jgi:hypothetical protein